MTGSGYKALIVSLLVLSFFTSDVQSLAIKGSALSDQPHESSLIGGQDDLVLDVVSTRKLKKRKEGYDEDYGKGKGKGSYDSSKGKGKGKGKGGYSSKSSKGKGKGAAVPAEADGEPTVVPTAVPTLVPTGVPAPSPVSLRIDLFDFVFEIDLGNGTPPEPSAEEHVAMLAAVNDFYTQVFTDFYADDPDVTFESLEMSFLPAEADDPNPRYGQFTPSNSILVDAGLLMEVYAEFDIAANFAEGSTVPDIQDIQDVFDSAEDDPGLNFFITDFLRPAAPSYAGSIAVTQLSLSQSNV